MTERLSDDDLRRWTDNPGFNRSREGQAASRELAPAMASELLTARKMLRLPVKPVWWDGDWWLPDAPVAGDPESVADQPLRSWEDGPAMCALLDAIGEEAQGGR